VADTDRLAEIKVRIALRHNNDEDHSPIDVHKAADGVVPENHELLHQLCIECSDDDTIGSLENGDLIDASAGVVFPCAAADVDWLVAEVERLTGARDHLQAQLDDLGAGQTEHIIDIKPDGWTIKHPLSCRPELFNCPVHNAAVAREFADVHPKPGQYGLSLDETGWIVIGEPVEARRG
jgi:hypothetical protein